MPCLHVGKKMTLAPIVHIFISLFFGVTRHAVQTIGVGGGGRSRVRFSMGSFDFFIDLNLPAAL